MKSERLLAGIAGLLCGAMIMAGWVAARPEVENPVHEVDKWCYYATYESMQKYQETTRPNHARIRFDGQKVVVHVDCERLRDGTLY